MSESDKGAVLTPGARRGAGRVVPWGLGKGSLVGKCRNRALSWKPFHCLLLTNSSGTASYFCLDQLLLGLILIILSMVLTLEL